LPISVEWGRESRGLFRRGGGGVWTNRGAAHMSSITPSPIASSVAQGALQQSQAARVNDARRNESARRGERMKEMIEKYLESVEDSYETTDDPMTIREDGEGTGGGDGGGRSSGGRARSERRETDEREGGEEGVGPTRLDVTA